MDAYKKAIETLKTSDIKLHVYKNQEETNVENQPGIFDFFYAEIFALEEVVQKYEEMQEKSIPKPMVQRKDRKTMIVALKEYICPVCGATVYAHHKYCWDCGQSLKFEHLK